MSKEYEMIVSKHETYEEYRDLWKFLLNSFLGGAHYRQAGYLTRYAYETETDYQERLTATPLDNHCKGVIDTYNSFLFRECPERKFGSLETDTSVMPFCEDADLEGRSLDAFMKDVSTYASVFGHTWVMVSKPQTNALTRADELAQGVRPYVSQISPLNVIDWRWERAPNGVYVLTRLKYYEDTDSCGCEKIVKEWTMDEILTYTIDDERKEVINILVEPNQLGKIPAVIVYAQRGPQRGVGISDINDIADLQKAIYNELSEIEQGIRLSSHPSLVKTPDTEAVAGAGAIIQIPDGLDPGLKPYLLENSGSNLTSIFAATKSKVDAIDRIAHTGSVRAISERTLSGVAMSTEFRQLEAKLSEKADNLAWAEENLWSLWSLYQGKVWDGEIEYPKSFSIQDETAEYEKLIKAKSVITDPRILQVIDYKVLELMDENPMLILPDAIPATEVIEAQADAAGLPDPSETEEY